LILRSDLDALDSHVNDLLARLIPKGLGKRGRRGAIDVVALPTSASAAGTVPYFSDE
jgi:hypothetical protein